MRTFFSHIFYLPKPFYKGSYESTSVRIISFVLAFYYFSVQIIFSGFASVEAAENTTLELTGTLLVTHVENFKTNTSEHDYTLTSGRKQYKLRLKKNKPAPESGSKIKVRGHVSGNELIAETVQLETAQTPQLLGATTQTVEENIVEYKTAVILVEFNNTTDADRMISRNELRTKFFGETDSVRSFYSENSYGKAHLSGDVFDYIRIDYPNTDCDNNYWTWSSLADGVLTYYGTDLSSYSKKMYVFARTPGCWWSGRGTIGGTPALSWVAGEHTRTYVYAHEYGHNLGVHHAASLSCGNKAIDVYTNCYVNEYGDQYDVMGLNFAQMNLPHKIALGWQSETPTITTNGTYTLTPLFLGSGQTGLIIPKGDTGEKYYIEYRQASGVDAYIPTPITEGVLVHVWDGNAYTQTKLLDMSPDPSLYYEMLTDGKSFEDEVNQIRLVQLSHSEQGVTLQVQFGPIASPTPSVSPTPEPSVSPSPSPSLPPCVATAPNTPILRTPTNNSVIPSARSVTLMWDKVTMWGINCQGNTNRYRVYVSTGNPPLRLVRTVSAGVTSHTFRAVRGHTYYWQIVAQNGARKSYSEIRSFTFR